MYQLNDNEVTEFQMLFVNACLLGNLVNNGSSNASKNYIDHVLDVLSEIMHTEFIDFAMECEEDSYVKSIDSESIKYPAMELIVLGFKTTQQEFLRKYVNAYKIEKTP